MQRITQNSSDPSPKKHHKNKITKTYLSPSRQIPSTQLDVEPHLLVRLFVCTCTCTHISIDINAVINAVLSGGGGGGGGGGVLGGLDGRLVERLIERLGERLDGSVDGPAEVPAVDCGVSTEGGVEEVRAEGVECYLWNSEYRCE